MNHDREVPPAEVLFAVVEALDHGVVAADGSGRVRYTNAAADEMLRMHPQRLEDITRLITPRDPMQGAATADDLIERARSNLERVEAPATLRRPDGTEIEITGELLPIQRNGEAVAGVSIFRDVTDETEALQRLARALADAERAVEVKTQFLADMSHEIRTPMNGVIGMMELLSATDLSAEQHQFIDIAKASCEALLDILNETLDFSKLEAGKVDLELEAFDAAGLAEDVAGLLATTAAGRGVDMHVHIGTGVPGQVIGDGSRVRQVLMNLVSNAVEFTESGAVTVSVERTVPLGIDQPSVALRYTVADTGCGIAADRLADLFLPFSRDPVVARSMPTTGLGLAISHQLIRLMGGELTCDSELGVGSTFSFIIPVEAADAGTNGVKPLPARTAVLVVVDDPVDRRIVREYCQRLGARVTEAPAVQLAEQSVVAQGRRGEAFDVVVCDIESALGGSAEAVTRVRSSSAVVDLPAVVLAPLGLQEDQRRKLMAVADAVVLKPVRHVRFATALSEVYWARHDDAPIRTAAVGGAVLGHSVLTDSTALAGAVTFVEPNTTVGVAHPGGDDRRRVLVAEDNPTNQIVIEAFLDRLGLAATVVSDGAAALEAARHGGHCAVLMDCEMPVMNGYDATRELRRLGGRFNNLPVVAMTANALEGDERRCLEAGMTAYLAKPLTIERLRDVLVACLPDLALPSLDAVSN